MAPVLCTKVNVTNRIPQHKFSQPSSLDVIGDALLFVGYICFQYCEPNTTGSELLFFLIFGVQILLRRDRRDYLNLNLNP